MSSASVPDGDRTAKARIRDAAIRRFAKDGVAATSVRAIAAEAGVSPALVIHHFGSKERLRVECDKHVAAVIREQKSRAVSAGLNLDPLAALRDHYAGDRGYLMPYLARTLIDGSPHVSALIDEIVADAVEYMEDGVEAGVLLPSAYPYERAAVVTLWSLGVLVLHEHLKRLVGADLMATPFDPSAAVGYLAPALEMFAEGLLTEEAIEVMGKSFAEMFPAPEGQGEAGPDASGRKERSNTSKKKEES